jgi:hypothetical protein
MSIKSWGRRDISGGTCRFNLEVEETFKVARWPRGTLYQQKLAITSPTSGDRSVSIVRSRTETMEFVYCIHTTRCDLVPKWGCSLERYRNMYGFLQGRVFGPIIASPYVSLPNNLIQLTCFLNSMEVAPALYLILCPYTNYGGLSIQWHSLGLFDFIWNGRTKNVTLVWVVFFGI